MSTATLSPDQQVASQAIDDWIAGKRFELTIGGLAGTGKSFLLGYKWPELSNAGCAVVAPTGKAGQVLQQKGLPATTIHKLIYDFKGIRELEDGEEEPIFVDGGGWGTANGKRPMRIAVDETSMVNDYIASDLRSRNLPMLWIGDHGQLMPVGGDPGIMRNPDIRLEKIHRQGADSPILNLAHAIRTGAAPSREFNSGNAVKIGRIDNDHKLVQYAIDNGINQIIVATNSLRHKINRLYRSKLGFKPIEPVCAGERLICLGNDYRYNVFNGQIFRADAPGVYDKQDNLVRVPLSEERIDGWRPLTFDSVTTNKPVSVQFPLQSSSLGQTLKSVDRDDRLLQFDYGYAITCHKSQGSEWDSVLVVYQDIPSFDMTRWLYTAITRAKQHVSIVLR